MSREGETDAARRAPNCMTVQALPGREPGIAACT
jgi:hypothetical protein